jgi:hypothetical protein
MFRGYRGIFVAVAGLALAGASHPPQQRQQAEQAGSTQQTEPPAEIIASAIRDTIIAPDEDRGCREGDDRGESDLCAQWKAADAARDAANYTWWGLLVGIAGTGLLLFTLAETRKIAQREQRAYVVIRVSGAVDFLSLENGSVRFRYENYGSTPALQVTSTTAYFIGPIPLLVEPAPEKWQTCGNGTVLHPREEDDFGLLVQLTDDEIAQVSTKNELAQLYVVARTTYRDVFGRGHVEQICAAIRYQSAEPKTVRIQKANLGNIST